MRPEILYSLFTPVTRLKGIGPNLGRLIERAIGNNLVDLLWHLPVGIIDRRYRPPVAEAQPGSIATLTVTVDAHWPPASSRMPYRVRCSDDSGSIVVTFFRAKGDWIEKILPLGSTRVISGRVESFNDQLQMSHPDHIAAPDDAEGAEAILSVEPVYRLTAGLTLKTLRKAADAALARTPELPEWLEDSVLQRQRWPGWRAALDALHHPQESADIDLGHPARRRLAYDELLADQLALALIRQRNRSQGGRAITGDGSLRDKVLAALPFKPTAAQAQAMAEVSGDMASNRRMLRLLQGDVGSGKTLVALMAMLTAVEAGSQAALMAPTEILARQHAATLTRMLEPAGLAPLLLTGRDKGRAREKLLAAIADGSAPIVIGTHALYQDDIVFRDLAMAVIDEQHRFGVEQRMSLASKGRGVDILVMTATPIPRSLMLAGYGDLDVSYLREKPAGRQKIATSVISIERLGETAAAVGRALASGTKIYWICPLIEESETSDLAAVEERHAMLRTMFVERVGLLHGRMKAAERDRVMSDFAQGSTDLLVATTVIEVGVDVPAATIMIIEHAERFGLAQLHQLRGRIGRGADASTCLLLYAGPLGETAKARLTIMRETEDGFRIAEEDLRLRGAGEMLGTKQSGLPEYRVADLAIHGELLAMAHDEARLILHRDAELMQQRGAALRTLLYLFERESAIRYLKSG
ncbi:MAG TPA: ATP-dependent DNA helicase RecG [Stellaceae bacterium]|nr:ATP-dependent DNA helicase RecG [Stellaceae bacterium]